jgi:hypothetical protein
MEQRKPELAETEEERRRQIELNQPAIALLNSWLNDDTETREEQQAALEELMRGIDANRPHRPLFEQYLKQMDSRDWPPDAGFEIPR